MTRFIKLLAVVLFACTVFAQSPQSDPWADWKFLLGEWTAGESGGVPGRASSGSFSLTPDLGGQVLFRKSHSEYPAANGHAAIVHDDLMVVYREAGTIKAFYDDNEGHVIRYNVTALSDKKKIIFLSDQAAVQPQFRLSYEEMKPGTVNVIFEIAPPDKPGQFSKYVEGVVVRTTGR
ncbi:MAG TPA: hypothetical protein VN176_07010 [Verrucomicrobiae bacterium]|nr:hypothetical protein [Verrucomicrobiae bacterium]